MLLERSNQKDSLVTKTPEDQADVLSKYDFTQGCNNPLKTHHCINCPYDENKSPARVLRDSFLKKIVVNQGGLDLASGFSVPTLEQRILSAKDNNCDLLKSQIPYCFSQQEDN